MKTRLILFTLLLTVASCQAQEHPESMIIESEILSRQLRFQIYDANEQVVEKPIIYLTDGQKMINHKVIPLLTELTESGRIRPAYYVFLSSIDPVTEVDYRNEYFFCNADHLRFFEQEFMPFVERQLPGTFSVEDRSLIGISFGGMNAAYFSAHATTFTGFGLLSPVTYPCQSLAQDIAFSANQNLNIYLSTGRNDAESYIDLLEPVYQAKDYRIQVVRTAGKHDFANWNQQWEDLVNFLLPPN